MTKTKEVDKKVNRFLEIKGEILILEKEQADLREELLEEVKKKYPDEKHSATVIAGNYNVKRIISKTVEWNLPEFKKLVGETAYREIVKIKETIDKSCEPKIKEKVEQGVIKKEDLFKVTKPKYVIKLMVKEKADESGEKEEDRDFLEMMDY